MRGCGSWEIAWSPTFLSGWPSTNQVKKVGTFQAAQSPNSLLVLLFLFYLCSIVDACLFSLLGVFVLIWPTWVVLIVPLSHPCQALLDLAHLAGIQVGEVSIPYPLTMMEVGLRLIPSLLWSSFLKG